MITGLCQPSWFVFPVIHVPVLTSSFHELTLRFVSLVVRTWRINVDHICKYTIVFPIYFLYEINSSVHLYKWFSVPSPQVWLTTSCNFSSRGFDALFWSPWVPGFMCLAFYMNVGELNSSQPFKELGSCFLYFSWFLCCIQDSWCSSVARQPGSLWVFLMIPFLITTSYRAAYICEHFRLERPCRVSVTYFLAPPAGRRKRQVVGPAGCYLQVVGSAVSAMASEQPRERKGEDSIKLSADVKPFVPKFAGLNVAWSESSEACVFPSCATTYYPFVQESPVTEQKMYPEDMAFGASTFPAQYVPSDMTMHPFAYSAYSLEPAQSVCSVPTLQYDYSQPRGHRGFQATKPPNEHMCPPQEGKPIFKKKSDERRTCDEQKFNNRRAGSAVPSEMRSARGAHNLSVLAESSLKPDGYHKRTDRKSRILTKSTSAAKPEFEFSRLDFPQLQSPKNNDVPEIQKQPRWGPLRSAANQVSLLEVGKPVAAAVEGGVVKTSNPHEAVANNAVSSSPSCTGELSWTPMGYIVRQTVSSDSSAVSENVSSMISLKTAASSADNKNVSVTSSEALSSDPSYSKGKRVHPTTKVKTSQGGELEQNETSRKNKKKKEKSKSKYEVLTVQEPPRIEDAEEFPNLSVASERRHRVESPKFRSQQQTQNDFKTSGKKSQIPVQLDLGGMLAALEKQQHASHTKPSSRPVVFSVGAVPVLSKEASSGERGRRSNQVKTPHNPLDSSAPLMKKGKQREIPKAKKPTSLKKIILKERQERMQQRLQENASSPTVDSDDAQDIENGADDQAPDQVHPTGPEKTEEQVSSTLVVERESEEPLGTELQRDPEACQPAPDHATFPKIHSRRFRDYCSQMLSKEVDACVTGLLKELVRFQDRMYQKDPVKAKTKRRLVLGLREVLKHLKLRKLKCIIISPNCEKTQSKGGLDDTLHTIIDCACEQNIPFVFALNRKALGRSLNKAVPVSVVGIFSYDGAQDQFHKMVELTMVARQAYKTMLEKARQESAGEPGPQSPPSPPTQGPSCPQGSPPASTGKEPHYIEIWRKHLEAYSQCALELEDSLEASTSQMMNLNL